MLLEKWIQERTCNTISEPTSQKVNMLLPTNLEVVIKAALL